MNFNSKIVRQVPPDTKELTSKVKPEVVKFIWSIQEVTNVRNNKLWNVPYCKFEAGGFYWKISLGLAESGNSVFARPQLLEPKESSASFQLKFHIVDNRGIIVYSTPFVNDHPVVAGEGATTTDINHRWEVIKLNNRPLDQFNTYVFQDTLKLLIEMTVFVDTQSPT